MGFFDNINKLDKPTPKTSYLDSILKKSDTSLTIKRFTQLYTPGGEFSLVKPINDTLSYEFKGSYHIHIVKGPMEGSSHKNKPHRTLIPLTVEVANMIRTKVGFECYPLDDYSKFIPQQNEETNQTGGGTY